MIRTDIRLATASIKSTKMRSILTMVAIIIGVCGFVMVTAFVDGLKSSVSNQISDYGGKLIAVNSGNIATTDAEGKITKFNPLAGFGGAPTLTEKDLKAIGKIDGVDTLAPQMFISLSGTVKRSEEIYDGVIIMATNENYPAIANQKLQIGNFWTEETNKRQVVVVGSKLAEKMFGGGFGLGAQVEIRREKFTVIGVLEKTEMGSMNFGADINNIALIPLATGKQFNGGAANISEIDVIITDAEKADKVASDIKKLLLNNHGGEKDFAVLKQDELISLTGNIFNQIKAFSSIITYVMLFVGGIVIALIMLITVKERTREIGIRKSIGATSKNILSQFIIEAIVISWVGSIIGILVAVLIGLYVTGTTDLAPAYSLHTLVSVVIISTVIGAVSGLIPAGMAAKKDPVRALRDE